MRFHTLVLEGDKNAEEKRKEKHWPVSTKIDKLTKQANNTGLTAYVYRVLSAETGEGWSLKIVDRKGHIYCQEVIGGSIRYVDRLGSRLYAKTEWRGNTFAILERFGKDVFSIDVST